MTKKQTLELIYAMSEMIDFKDIFYTIYGDILIAKTGKTKTGLTNKTGEYFRNVDCGTDKLFKDALTVLCDSYIGNSKDVSIWPINTIDNAEIVFVEINDMKTIDDDGDAATLHLFRPIVQEDESDNIKQEIINFIIMADIKNLIKEGMSDYYYSIMGHEIVHTIMYIIDDFYYDDGYSQAVGNNGIVMEYLCDVWGFALTALNTKNSHKYEGETLFDKYKSMLAICNRECPDEYEEINDIVKEVPEPEWLQAVLKK